MSGTQFHICFQTTSISVTFMTKLCQCKVPPVSPGYPSTSSYLPHFLMLSCTFFLRQICSSTTVTRPVKLRHIWGSVGGLVKEPSSNKRRRVV